jgi:DHA1 family bicyclomycin/chloramphenicol resistance-like MFS transporter
VQKKMPSRAMIIFILGAFDTIAPLTIDMYLPAFSTMAAEFGTTEARISLSLTSYFIGLGLGQIFYGPLLDRFGRLQPLTWGMILYVVACVGCIFSTTVEELTAFRFVQALGSCVAAVGVRAMVRDYFSANESAKIYSMLMLILAVSPLLAPSLGSIITTNLNWQWVFVVLAVIVTAIVIIMHIVLPEAHPPDPTVSLSVRPMLNTFLEILRNKQFTTYTLATSFTFGGLFIYLTGSTVILLGEFKISAANYAILFAVQSVGLIAGNQINILLLKKFSGKTIFLFALAIQVVGALTFFGFVLMGWNNVPSTICFFFIQLACLGLTFPNGSAIALEPFTKNLGSASALMGFLQIGIGGLASAVVGISNVKGSLPIAGLLFLTSTIAFIILLIGIRLDWATKREAEIAKKPQ